MTLAEAAQRSGYSQAAINGLEKHGSGSARLQEKLQEVYGLNENRLAEPAGQDWRSRALVAEEALRALKLRLLEVAGEELNKYPKPPKKKGKTKL